MNLLSLWTFIFFKCFSIFVCTSMPASPPASSLRRRSRTRGGPATRRGRTAGPCLKLQQRESRQNQSSQKISLTVWKQPKCTWDHGSQTQHHITIKNMSTKLSLLGGEGDGGGKFWQKSPDVLRLARIIICCKSRREYLDNGSSRILHNTSKFS